MTWENGIKVDWTFELQDESISKVASLEDLVRRALMTNPEHVVYYHNGYLFFSVPIVTHEFDMQGHKLFVVYIVPFVLYIPVLEYCKFIFYDPYSNTERLKYTDTLTEIEMSGYAQYLNVLKTNGPVTRAIGERIVAKEASEKA